MRPGIRPITIENAYHGVPQRKNFTNDNTMTYTGFVRGDIDLVEPSNTTTDNNGYVTTSNGSYTQQPTSSKPTTNRIGPRAIGFDDPSTLPKANFDRSSNSSMPHDFLAPGLFSPKTKQNNTSNSEIQNEFLDQQENRLRGTIVKEDEIENKDS